MVAEIARSIYNSAQKMDIEPKVGCYSKFNNKVCVLYHSNRNKYQSLIDLMWCHNIYKLGYFISMGTIRNTCKFRFIRISMWCIKIDVFEWYITTPCLCLQHMTLRRAVLMRCLRQFWRQKKNTYSWFWKWIDVYYLFVL